MILDRGYLDHWKTNLLRQLTGLPHASELPIRLWEYCEARRDDFVEDRTGHVIAGICRAGIEPKALITALIQCRFIVKEPKGFTVHGWRERNHSWLAKIEGGKKRMRGAKRDASGKVSTSNQAATSQLAGNTNASTAEEAGNTAGAVEWSGVEKSREPADSPPRGGVSECEQVKNETWHFILGLFGKKNRRPGYEADAALARQVDSLPLSAEQREILAWHYSLPHDPKDIDLRARFGDADKLAINLFAAIERAEAYAKKSARPQKKETAAPAGWEAWFAGKFPGKAAPASFDELPEYLRDDARRELGGQS